jgi:Na+-driven multidrug efflux pump
LGSLGFIIGAGGSALVAKILGEGHKDKAQSIFTLLVIVSVALGTVLALLGQYFLKDVAIAFGADGQLLENCVLYGRIILCSLVAFVLQNVFQSFFIVAEKPALGLAVMMIAGVSNIFFDYLFIVTMNMGLQGAALATVTSQCLGALLPIIYFAVPNSGLLRFRRAVFSIKAIAQTFMTGLSEFMTNVSASVISMLYNYQLMRYIGEDGVAAYGVMVYVNFLFMAVFYGYVMGCSPVVSYHYGADNKAEMHNLLKKSLIITTVVSVVLTVIAEVLANPIANTFVGYDESLCSLTRHAFRIYCIAFLFMGFNIFVSAFFTALNNGVVSAVVSFGRTFVFEVLAVILLPMLLGIDGIWAAIICAEVAAVVLSGIFLCTKRKKYGY